ncbi:MAG: hypothetical protein J7539_05445 [Niabella sp.]|nr:hypothetical protein [Niabella sp.]
MKYLLYVIMGISFWACNAPSQNTALLQRQIDSLQAQLHKTYKPGLGEFMSGIQVHHNKLWFAGINRNWALADFEINEIKESLEDIKTYCADRPETKSIEMIGAPIQNVSTAIQQKDDAQFKNSFKILTATCNTCHQGTKHGFNVITIPATPPFSNQDFKAPVEK